MSSSVVPSWSRTAAARRSISSRLAARDGTGWLSPSLCVWTCEVEKPSAPSSSAACNAATMAAMSSGVAAPPTARSPMTRRRNVEWPTRNPALTAMLPVEAAEPLSERGPVPGQPGPERRERHTFDPGHHAADVIGVLGAQWREGEAAVAAEHRRDAVQRGGAGIGVPRQLRVVVRVQVDEAGCDEHPAGVDHRGVARRGTLVGARRPPLARPRRRRRPRRAQHPVPSTTVPPLMTTVMLRPLCTAGPGRDTVTRWRANACMPSGPSSTPKPDCFHPPIGAYMSMDEMPCVLTNTVPADSRDRDVGRQRVVVAPDRGTEPELGVVRRPHRFLDVVVGDHRQRRCELLLADDPGGRPAAPRPSAGDTK